MGGLVVNDNVQYYVIAQDILAVPNISSNPSGVMATDVNTVTTAPVTPNNYNIANTITTAPPKTFFVNRFISAYFVNCHL